MVRSVKSDRDGGEKRKKRKKLPVTLYICTMKDKRNELARGTTLLVLGNWWGKTYPVGVDM